MPEGYIRNLFDTFYGVRGMCCDHVHSQGKWKLNVANWTASGIRYGGWCVHPGGNLAAIPQPSNAIWLSAYIGVTFHQEIEMPKTEPLLKIKEPDVLAQQLKDDGIFPNSKL